MIGNNIYLKTNSLNKLDITFNENALLDNEKLLIIEKKEIELILLKYQTNIAKCEYEKLKYTEM